MQAHPTRRQAIRAGAMARPARAQGAGAVPMPWPWSGAYWGTKAVAERKAKGGLGCPVSHPEHGDTLNLVLPHAARAVVLVKGLQSLVPEAGNHIY